MNSSGCCERGRPCTVRLVELASERERERVHAIVRLRVFFFVCVFVEGGQIVKCVCVFLTDKLCVSVCVSSIFSLHSNLWQSDKEFAQDVE